MDGGVDELTFVVWFVPVWSGRREVREPKGDGREGAAVGRFVAGGAGGV